MKRIFTLLSALPALLLVSGSLNAQQTIYTESFSYPPGAVAPGWSFEGQHAPNWKVNNSQISGGTAPEFYMGYGMQEGLTRVVSPAVTITGYKHLALSYNQYLINFAADAGETVGMDVTFDGGQTWQTLWEKPLGLLNIPQDRFTYFITAPEGATQMQYAFRFIGNHFFINGWAIDDVKIEEAVDKDLVAGNITGNTAINAGQIATFVVDVTNGGKSSQNNYTVKLKSGDGAELAAVSGAPLNFGEKSQVSLTWTPQPGDIPGKTLYAVVESADDINPDNNASRDLAVIVLKENTTNVQIGTESYALQHSIPFNFYTLYSLSQTLYTAQQIGNSGSKMTGIQYVSHFDEDNNDIPVQIYLAETDQEDLSSEWLNPASFTKVYDGTLDFKKGLNNLYIPLQTEFNYTGKNLVIYTNKTHPQQVLWSTFMSTYVDGPVVSRYSERDDAPFDAMTPPEGYPAFYTPNVTLFFEDGSMSVIDSGANTSVSVYPNPAKDFLKIKTDGNERALEIRMFSAAGQQVLHKKLDKGAADVDIRGLRSGYYLAQVTTSAGTVTRKVLVNN
ncbi:hypothetical protein FIC_01134 [Flavobacteriaceae bacterium 3519-10]|nr:hypothetical protein FIC_01134 [Flavobacteriaceae bacterium 3519-10]